MSAAQGETAKPQTCKYSMFLLNPTKSLLKPFIQSFQSQQILK